MSYCIDMNQPFMAPQEEIMMEVSSVLESGILTNYGPKHKEFKLALRNYLSSVEPVLFANGHAALENAIRAFDFPVGSEIITTPFTFISTINAIVRCGLIPVFCDIRQDNYTMDAEKIEGLISQKTVAILPVHLFGTVCDVEKIHKIAQDYELKVIYDAAHAFGTRYKGESVANYGDAVMFSFHASKILNSAEGGAVFTKDTNIADQMLALSNFGIKREKDILYVGENAKLSEFHAAIGICNLRHVDEEINRRKQLSFFYKKFLGGRNEIQFLPESIEIESNYSYMPVVFGGLFDRNKIALNLEREGINCRKSFYPLPCKAICFNENHFVGIENIPIADYVSSHILTLPMYGNLTEEQVRLISAIILNSVE